VYSMEALALPHAYWRMIQPAFQPGGSSPLFS
jgi:hypothetical protein